MSKEKQPLPDTLQQAANQLETEFNWLREVDELEIEALLDHWPYLQIVSTEPVTPEMEGTLPHVIEAESGWKILHYGDAMSTSVGEFLWGGGDYTIPYTEDGKVNVAALVGSLNMINSGKGTIRNQAFQTARQMGEMAYQQGWPGIHIIDGHPIMKRAIWITALELGMGLDGFMPELHDYKVHELLEMSPTEMDALRKQMGEDWLKSKTKRPH